MNKRIKKLAKEAGINLDYFGHGSCTDGGNPNVKKFAELIVKQCATLIDDAEDAVVIYSTKTGLKVSRSEMIRQYFGVK